MSGTASLPEGGWRLAAALVALVCAAPVASLAWLALGGDASHWRALASDVLPRAALNTVLLLAGVGLVAGSIGTGAAWLVTVLDFPGRRGFDWLLLLPLAMPTYIVAFAYLDLLHPLGALQSTLRWLLGYDSPRQWRLGDIRHLGGAIALLGVVLYPYVYLTARAMFMTQPAHLMEAARTLGLGPWSAFARLAVPLARPALAVGLSLVLLETLNDIGASEFLGVNTLTVAIYTTWITRSDLPGAAQLALLMLATVLTLIVLERRGRARQRFASMQRMRPVQPRRVGGWRGWAIAALLALPVLAGFGLPALHLAWQAARRLGHAKPSQALADAALNTLGLAAGVTLAAVVCGLLVAWTTRAAAVTSDRRWTRLPGLSALARVSSIGYALPGTVLAVGLLAPALALDYALGNLLGRSDLLLLGSGAVLAAGCTIRFLPIVLGAVESALTRLPRTLEQAARLLGDGPGRTLARVHLPLLRPALAAGAMLVFADAMKELPATLLLRPANFETLSTLLYAEAARGTYEEGALAALAIVAAGLLPVALLARTQLRAAH